jgi:transposase
MYIKKSKDRKGREYWAIAEGYYNPTTKNTKTVVIEKVGYLDELEKEYPDPKAHFQAIVDKMNAEKKKDAAAKSVTITIDTSSQIRAGVRKNFGYAALSCVYHELELDKFFANRQRSLNVKFNLNAIMRLLVFSRLLAPGSKRKAFEERGRFFERGKMTLDDVYRFLTAAGKYRDALQVWLHERITANYGRDTTITYYDVTNYYFEIDKQDELRRKGVSKEHRPDPIVQMGLFTDNSGLPLAYQLFPGNNNDCTTFLPVIKRLRREFGIGKAVVVSDKAMNTQKNAYYLANHRGGYVFSQSVRGGTKALKAYVLKEKGYVWTGDDFKKKSRQFTRDIEFEDDDGTVITAKIAEKQVVFYSRDYDKKAKADRETAVQKAVSLIKNPEKYNKYNTYGAAKYIKHIEFDEKTGEIIKAKSELSFNEEKLKQDELYDGYYVIVTNLYNADDDWVIDSYKGLWRIEETFKVTKSDLEARPVYVSREDHIQAHFLICFTALVIIRLLQKKMGSEYASAAEKILDSLSKACCTNFKNNLFVFDHFDKTLEDAGRTLGIDFNKEFRTREEIKKIIADTKKN